MQAVTQPGMRSPETLANFGIGNLNPNSKPNLEPNEAVGCKWNLAMVVDEVRVGAQRDGLDGDLDHVEKRENDIQCQDSILQCGRRLGSSGGRVKELTGARVSVVIESWHRRRGTSWHVGVGSNHRLRVKSSGQC